MNLEASVILPCWNVAAWVEDAVKSVLVGLPERAEVIAVDDGSTDDTPVLLARLAAADGRIRVLTQSNRGVSAARNRGLDAARGDYVFFVDPDDTVAPDFFSSMLAAVRAAQADYCVCGMTGFPMREDYRFTTNAAIRDGFVKRIIGYGYDEIRAWYRGRELFAERELASVWRAVFRRDLIERHRIRFDTSVALYEDALFNAAYLLHAQTMTSVKRPLYRMHMRETGAMRRLGREAAFVCRNKLALLRARNALDRQAHGTLAALYAGTCVTGALEMLALTVRGRLPRRDGWRLLRDYLQDATVRRALAGFPLSARKPLVALAVVFLRFLARIRSGKLHGCL